jgi:hypothetical protein
MKILSDEEKDNQAYLVTKKKEYNISNEWINKMISYSWESFSNEFTPIAKSYLYGILNNKDDKPMFVNSIDIQEMNLGAS